MHTALSAVAMEAPADHSHLVSGCQEPGVVLKRLFDQSTEAVKQGEQLLHILLRILKTTQLDSYLTNIYRQAAENSAVTGLNTSEKSS